MREGLTQNTVNCIYQDSEGIMWFGTRGGLNKFNGYNFESFTNNINDSSSLSDNHVFCIAEDNNANLWIGTSFGLNRLDRSDYSILRIFPEDKQHHSNNAISAVFFDSIDNVLWIGTSHGLTLFNINTLKYEKVAIPRFNNTAINVIKRCGDQLYFGGNDGFIIYNLKKKTSRIFLHEKNNIHSLSDNIVRDFLIDKNGKIWIATRNGGINVLNPADYSIVHIDQSHGLTNNYVRTLCNAPDGSILAGTFNGLNILDSDNYSIRARYDTYDTKKGDLSHYSILDVFFDSAGSLWVGTYGDGVNYSSQYDNRFPFINPSEEQRTILGVMGTATEHDGKLYIASEGGGLLEYELATQKIMQYKIVETAKIAYEQNILKSLFFDGDKILCGTNTGRIYVFNLKTKRFSLFYDIAEEKSINQISRLRNGDLAIASISLNGLIIVTPTGKRSKQMNQIRNVRCLVEVDDSTLYLGTRNNGIYRFNRFSGEYTQFQQESDVRHIAENFITCIMQDKQGHIWAGSFGGGLLLYDQKTDTWKNFSMNNGLLNNYVCQIVEYNDKIWISMINGLSEYNPLTDIFRNYSYENGIKITEFSHRAGLQLHDNLIYFGGNNGFTLFNPDYIKINSYIPPVIIENLYIDNKVVEIGSNILSKQLSKQKQIVLKYNQNNFSIEYSALNYINPHNNRYSYMLEGFDTKWNTVESRRMAYYTNISPGTYLFKVKASNNDGIWNETSKEIRITILPPLWKTWYAYLIYSLLVIVVILLIFKYLNNITRLKNDVKLKQIEKQTIEEFHQARNKLFTNFSHELRTPLTLILSPIEDMLQKGIVTIGKDTLLLMRNNSLRLLRIVNNLMDFQKKESGTLSLHVSRDNFHDFSSEMFLAFKELAIKRHINYEFYSSSTAIDAWFDKTLMEKVFFNFLSNAFKNVSDEGKITVTIQVMNFDELSTMSGNRAKNFSDSQIPYILFDISDTGLGIEPKDLEDIFDPFFQVAQNEHSSSGTGLGLTISKSIIEMHHGIVWAESETGKGASFKAILPVSKSLFNKNEFGEISATLSSVFELETDEKNDFVAPVDSTKKYTILVVEDNKDVRNYILNQLAPFYNLQEAANGKSALEKVLWQMPDMVITDLMMPKMDGIELTNILKTDIRTSHIPVIIITARAMVGDILEGYETGADDYLTKPFSSAVLLARIHNIFQTREKLKDLYCKNFTLENIGVELTSSDERFMQKLYAFLEENLSNSDLNGDALCSEFNMSQSSFYRKIKSITNFAPNDFIKNYRLKMAAKILTETNMAISDIFVVVGFNSLPYFSNAFKQHFGLSPTEYKKSAH
ncbi:hybrid sensor histidine kinase/response regulator [Bacteroidia bacterium]|nr:hybrid sensor histidine kinase/response regulator [Bacteroidia bacterium]